jgi:hypothetical protein
MNTLIYKRTHKGDPGEAGVFGEHDCMGRVRSWGFDAVIGVGGKRPWRKHAGIAEKINWIGLNAIKTPAVSHRWTGPIVTFQKFVLYDEQGPSLKKFAPRLHRYMFEEKHVRAVLSRSLPSGTQKEIGEILKLARTSTASASIYRPRTLARSKCCGIGPKRSSTQPKC